MKIELTETEQIKLDYLLTEFLEKRNIKIPLESNILLDALQYDIWESIETYLKAVSETELE